DLGDHKGWPRLLHCGCIEGNFGFGFSVIEVKLLMVVNIFNNGGVYGGDRRIPEEIMDLTKMILLRFS
ncbi:hypothetical protein S245_017801, partial [Arachis hypogaea]